MSSLLIRRSIAACAALVYAIQAVPTASADITINAANVVRKVPEMYLGTNINAHVPTFASKASDLDFHAALKAAKVQCVRTLAYPDYRKPDHTVEYFDANVKAILSCGAKPLLVEYINPGQAYYREDGVVGTADNPGSPESNLVYMVRHYMEPPFNLTKQVWEVGNEPDIGVDFKTNAESYCLQFNRVHEALIKAGLRDNVVLCGPVISQMYWNRAQNRPPASDYLETFMNRCSEAVDIVDTHTYCTFGALQQDELLGLTRIDKCDNRFVADQANMPGITYDGMAALLAKMDAISFSRPNVGIAITEYGATTHRQPITGALWNLCATQAGLYNPRMRMMNSFVFDSLDDKPDTISHYGRDKKPNDLYWALWMAGNLRGDEVLKRNVTGNAMSDGRSYLVVGATRDKDHLYIEVINRSSSAIVDKMQISGVAVSTDAEAFEMSEKVAPDTSKPFMAGPAFEYRFPGASATVFKLALEN